MKEDLIFGLGMALCMAMVFLLGALAGLLMVEGSKKLALRVLFSACIVTSAFFVLLKKNRPEYPPPVIPGVGIDSVVIGYDGEALYYFMHDSAKVKY